MEARREGAYLSLQTQKNESGLLEFKHKNDFASSE
jgi:hypothetical protein